MKLKIDFQIKNTYHRNIFFKQQWKEITSNLKEKQIKKGEIERKKFKIIQKVRKPLTRELHELIQV